MNKLCKAIKIEERDRKGLTKEGIADIIGTAVERSRKGGAETSKKEKAFKKENKKNSKKSLTIAKRYGNI